MKKYLVFILIFLSVGSPLFADLNSEVASLVQNGGVVAVGPKGDILFDHQGQKPFIPASTLKILTALISIEALGKDYHFKTEFYLSKEAHLTIKGYGDPYLVSEELASIAKNLKSKGLKKVQNIYLDDSYFDKIVVPGVSASNNPYDALNSALSANFNTINIIKNKGGEVSSAETQTPMTELTRLLAAKAPYGKSRINLAAYPKESLLYVGYLMKEFLLGQGIEVQGTISATKSIVSHSQLYYSHLSSKNLTQVLQPMLEFSTNFIANQLFLIIGAEKLGAPANLAKSVRVYDVFIKERLKLSGVKIEEGSGISRGNKISALQMLVVLHAFEKYDYLLPEKLKVFRAKTGTLNGVSSLVGYFQSATKGKVKFAILLNQTAGNREKVAQALYKGL